MTSEHTTITDNEETINQTESLNDNNDIVTDVIEDKQAEEAETKTKAQPSFDPEMIALIRKEVLAELSSADEVKKAKAIQSREDAKKTHDEYILKMQESSDPWVEIQGWVETREGIRVELEWNTAFVEHLKHEGVTGADDDQVVQQWVTLLLRDMSDQMSEPEKGESEFS